MNKFYNIPNEAKKRIFAETGRLVNLPAFAVEKDWWVVQTLRVIKSTDAADALLFKGGTSLSKAWDLIHRFSEDVDLAIDRLFLGVQDVPDTNKKLRKLREKSRKYLTSDFIPPEEFINAYEKDYGTMNDEMIHGDSLTWKGLINRLQEFREEFNSQSWQIKIPK